MRKPSLAFRLYYNSIGRLTYHLPAFPRQHENVDLEKTLHVLYEALYFLKKNGYKPHARLLNHTLRHDEYGPVELALQIVYRALKSRTKNPYQDLSSWLHYAPIDQRTQADVEDLLRSAIRRTHFEPYRRKIMIFVDWFTKVEMTITDFLNFGFKKGKLT